MNIFDFLHGSVLGVVAGLLPGIHPNFVSFIAESGSTYFLVPLAVINSIINTIPSIIFGAPEVGNEMSVLPGHALLMKGRAYDAVRRTIIGSALSGLLAIPLVPLAWLISRAYYEVELAIPIILAIVVAAVLLSENDVQFAAFCFVFSGIIGLASREALLPALSGMFGLSRLLLSGASIPPQTEEVEFMPSNVEMKSSVVGSILGMVTGFVPGVGASQAAFVASKLKGDFLTALGAITTSNVIFSMAALYFIGKVRTGVAQYLSISTFKDAVIMFALALVSVAIGSAVALLLAKLIVRGASKIKYATINRAVVEFIIAVTFVTCGTFGLLVLFTSTSLGIMAIKKGVKQSNLLGVVIIPTLIYFMAKFI